MIVKDRALEVPPPGAGFTTVTLALPTEAISLAWIAAVSWLLETNVVVRSEPPHFTTAPLTKLVPLTVSVKPAPPAVAEEGLKPVRLGTGLDAWIVKLRAPEVPPPGAGLKTVRLAVPTLAMSAAVIAALN